MLIDDIEEHFKLYINYDDNADIQDAIDYINENEDDIADEVIPKLEECIEVNNGIDDLNNKIIEYHTKIKNLEEMLKKYE